jgi:uncharacterized protein (DUF433 family)
VVHQSKLIDRNDEVLSGAAVFTGTRVPVQALWDYLEEGADLDEFLADFPLVPRDQALAVLELPREAVLDGARLSE